MNPPKQKGLGRGLDALLAANNAPETQRQESLPVASLQPGKYQPRTRMDPGSLEELAASIKAQGLIQPISVRPIAAGRFEIIAGERRWRAAQKAQLHEVPIVVRELSDRDTLEIALIENIQRQDLNPIEEARGYRRLMQEFAYTQEVLSERIGKSRPHIANLLRLLELPEIVRAMLAAGKLSPGHVRPLINLPNVVELAQTIVAKGLSVREAERLAAKAKARPRSKAAKAQREKDADTKALERDLTNKLGLKVEIEFDGKGGSVTLRYQSLEQLDLIIEKLNG